MNAIKLGIIFDQKLETGGGYQQALNSALLAAKLPAKTAEVHFFTTEKENVEILAAHDIVAKFIRISLAQKIWCSIRARIVEPRILKLLRLIQKYSPLEKFLLASEIDLVYFLSPSRLPKYLEHINYIVTVWDLCHRDHPEFPEVGAMREFEVREKIYHDILPKATAVLVDSQLGRKNVVTRYRVDKRRVHVMPFEASEAVRVRMTNSSILQYDVRKKYQLDVPYVFYPAQFWAHKNHVYLLEGLKILDHKYGIKIGAIFSGADKGNMQYIKDRVRILKLSDCVRFAGFVKNEEIIELYRQSIALVMPTYFGPTNLPPIEAFELEVPVLYPDEPGMREQVGSGALLIDLKDPTTMANQLRSLIDDDEIKATIKKAGVMQASKLRKFNRSEVLLKIINSYSFKRACWK